MADATTSTPLEDMKTGGEPESLKSPELVSPQNLDMKTPGSVAPSQADAVSECGSARSSSSSGSRYRDAKARLELSKLKKVQLKRKQKMVEQKMMLQMQLELQAAEDEEEQAELVAQIYMEEEMQAEENATGDRPDVTQDSPPAVTHGEVTSTTLAADEHGQSKANRNDDSGIITFPSTCTSKVSESATSFATTPHTIPSSLDQSSVTQLCKALTLTMNMPKPDMKTFSGDPAEYWSFVTSFETNIGSKLTDERLKLTYLVQFCRGKAKESVENCILMEPTEGYKTALAILRNQFGQPHLILHALFHKVTNRGHIRQNDGNALWDLARDMRKCHITLSQLGYNADMNSSENLLKVQRLLPVHIQAAWAKTAQTTIESKHEPTFLQMTEFVEQRAKTACNMYGQNISKSFGPISVAQSARTKPKLKPNKVTTLSTRLSDDTADARQDKQVKCPCCNQGHKLAECTTFAQKSYEDRRQFVRDNKLCDNCFIKWHVARRCRFGSRCGINGCKWKHHTLLHQSSSSTTNHDQKAGANSDNRKPESVGVCGSTGAGREEREGQQDDISQCHTLTSRQVALRVLPVKVQQNDHEVETCALLDEGSDVSLCDEKLAKQLGIQGERFNFSLNTVGGTTKYYGMEVSLKVKSIHDDNELHIPRVRTVESLPISRSVFPSQKDMEKWKHLQGIKLPETGGQPIQLLIGGDVPEAFWVMEQRRGRRKEPYAVKSLLGWTLVGPMLNTNASGTFSSNHVNVQDEQLLQQVQKFWEVDFGGSIMDSKRGESVEDRRARHLMEESARHVDGHYEVGLPWSRQHPNLPENRAMAEVRLTSLKRRLQKNEELCEQYKGVIEDYLHKGYARPVPHERCKPEPEVGEKWYLPHHPVLSPQKPGKTRVVFDCAARYGGTSLNDQLLQGPDYTNNLVGVLTRFRQEPIALMSDVEAMFHQVRVPERDRDALRFLWWPDHDLTKEPSDFQMQVHLFGATSSPSCAGFALQRTADDYGGEFGEEAVSAVRDNFYVDDCLVSVSSKEAGIRLASSLIGLLHKGGFRLRKWLSNDREVLTAIPASERAPSVMDLDLGDLPQERTLGIQWNAESDVFGFKTALKERPLTRRGILSTVSSLYDPLGFLAPFILPAKILLQDICRKGLGWDEKVEERELFRWRHWLDDLPKLETIAIDRCLKPKGFDAVTVSQLHLFSDASERGYASVAYLRMADKTGRIHCSFVTAKARLCPKKSTSIPRLELTAAVLSVQLSKMILEELRMPINEVMFWTDSTSVLMYIQNESRRFHTFVANRVAKIQDATDNSQWRYVDSELNPADDGSRGLTADRMVKEDRWLKGPRFLMMNEDHWPVPPVVLQGTIPDPEVLTENNILDKDPEVKKVVAQMTLTQKPKLDEFLSKYSSWNRLKRGAAWLLRFGDYLQLRSMGKMEAKNMNQGSLTVEEFQRAERGIIRYVQNQAFPKEMEALYKRKQNPDTSRQKSSKQHPSLFKLNPTLMDGILRVGGRLRNAPVDEGMKHPIILPRDHRVTDLIIVHHHLLVGHSGVGLTWTSLRDRFWVIRGGTTVRRVIGNCFDCKRRNAPLRHQMMADLPAARVTPDNPPFTSVGVDYFGPFYVKQGRSQVKRYGCVFTCLTMRAVHLEIAHTLDTDSFINCLRRFIARRGRPQLIMSDNGTNFVGGERELRENLLALNQQKVSDFLLQQSIKWQFNPPAASHMGGIWERLIRSVRRILGCLLKEQIVSDEVLLTLMTEVEAILNARPLTPVSFDPDDNEPLTPNHLLLLRANPSLPPGLFQKEDAYGHRRWRQTQYLADQFWRRWVREYLPILQVRQKWTKPEQNLRVGDVVLVANENMARGRWPLGRITNTYLDHLGNVRQVEVKTGTSYLRRPITKLCLVDSSSN